MTPQAELTAGPLQTAPGFQVEMESKRNFLKCAPRCEPLLLLIHTAPEIGTLGASTSSVTFLLCDLAKVTFLS